MSESTTEQLSPRVRELLETSQRADRSLDADLFSTVLTEDVEFQLGPTPPVRGRAAVRDAVAGFFTTIAGMDQRFVRGWEHPAGVTYEAEVTYRTADGTTLTLPYCNVWDLRDGLVARYRIYIDIGALAVVDGASQPAQATSAPSAVTVLPMYRAKPERVQEMKDVMLAELDIIRSQPGCIDIEMHQDQHDPASFMVYENWSSQEQLTTWLGSEECGRYVERLTPLFDGEIHTTLWRMFSPAAS